MAKRYRRTPQPTSDEIIDRLQRRILSDPSFNKILFDMERRIAQKIFDELATQPLEQLGTALGKDFASLFSSNAYSFSLSKTQTGALFSQLIDSAEEIL